MLKFACEGMRLRFEMRFYVLIFRGIKSVPVLRTQRYGISKSVVYISKDCGKLLKQL